MTPTGWDGARGLVEAAFNGDLSLEEQRVLEAVRAAVDALDRGVLRSAEQQSPGQWTTNAWVKQAILLYFALAEDGDDGGRAPSSSTTRSRSRRTSPRPGVRVVPPGTIRYGAFVEPGVIVMPGYVNIGALRRRGTMVDTWATVGSCAQIGQATCTSPAASASGGVLEPPGAQPVIVEDGCFVGSRVVVTEGAVIEQEAVLGPGVIISATIPIYDVREGQDGKEFRGRVPARAVVVGGVRPRRWPGGESWITCNYIIGERKESTDKKVSLEGALREYGISS